MRSSAAPWKARSFAGLVVWATKLRPYSPRVAHGTSEAGLPETAGEVGAVTPGSVVVSAAAKRRLAQSKNPSATTSRVTTTAATRNKAALTMWATRRGSRRASSLSSSTIPWPTTRPTRNSSPNTTSVAATIGANTPGPTCSMPTRSRCWFCHPGQSASPATTTTTATTPSASHP
jgi:hypothetical protein